MNKKSIIKLTSALIVGIIFGLLGAITYFGETARSSMELMGLEFRADWEERASQAYLKEKPEIAIWALKNLADILHNHEELFINHKSDIQTDLILAYGRLAIVYQAQGNKEKYNENLLKAFNLAVARYPGEIKKKQDVINFIDKIDKK